MIANSEQWIGQTVDGKFRLERALGGSGQCAVFLAEQIANHTPIVVRFVEAESPGAPGQLRRWEAAAKLNHPNLMRIFETGRSQIAGHQYCYVVSEYGEENLAQIIPERALSGDETRQVLRDVLAAIAYIHGQGLVHGNLKPSQIFAVGDAVKLSSDTLLPSGQRAERTAAPPYDAPEAAVAMIEPSANIWSLGVVLVEALTQRKPLVDWPREQPALSEKIPQPFRDIAENCLHPEPSARWTVAQIESRLREKVTPVLLNASEGSSSAGQQRARSAKWLYAVAALMVIALIVFLIPRAKAPVPPSSTQQSTERNASPSSSTSPTSPAPTTPSPTSSQADGQVAERLMPRVSPSALHTIQGKIKVLVDLKVDNTGKVTEAHLKSPGSSRYFAERALEAAMRWTFKPPVESGQPVASEWRVRFTFSRRAVDDATEQLKP